jgi:hypothetical protein
MTISELEARVRKYAEEHWPYSDFNQLLGVDFAQPLGFGQDGHVWKTFHKTAVKAFERTRNYTVERDCYQRLLDADVSLIDGLNVPRLVEFDDELQIIEMEIVKPP